MRHPAVECGSWSPLAVPFNSTACGQTAVHPCCLQGTLSPACYTVLAILPSSGLTRFFKYSNYLKTSFSLSPLIFTSKFRVPVYVEQLASPFLFYLLLTRPRNFHFPLVHRDVPILLETIVRTLNHVDAECNATGVCFYE